MRDFGCPVSIRVNAGDQVRHGPTALLSDLAHANPKRVFKADAGLVSSNNNGSLDDMIVTPRCQKNTIGYASALATEL
jgi:hypothetical protein